MNETSVFERALGAEWGRLAPVIRRHYGLSGGAALTMKGTMERVGYLGVGRLIAPFARLMGALVPYSGEVVPIEVENWSEPRRNGFFWRRTFHFPGRPVTLFRSCMEYDRPGEIVEYMGFGLGIRMALEARPDGGVRMTDRGYVLRLAGVKLPLPLHWVMGRALIEEWPTGEEAFAMRLDIVHPWWGPTFHYSGGFRLGQVSA